ncbi:Alpha-1,6-mannosyl-glycoprotein 2-beta-N-acetylglucosaminyltransferase [Chionoecetes opilio]|uniref:Alpha-1,6-mannosyl-glycoprotein 2-beta-N-acetylglucosaminyltransferase n=1 Tax=Chionoecetes opilio TaxID=41210 RepID=A0A8J5D0Q0_CHIOP|nr:Alpha-1,6-mannosyl-glycoprotein 2-beta-N-acetylglucosaminyltransferase [Chionoecetes opilio]
MRNTTIVLVQVHKRLENLRYLVSSLRAVKDIERAVVVFSHDFWDPDINLFVRNITAFRVMQMFFPYSIQLYPHVFPGRDPQDCSWNTNTSKALQQACQNAKWPDSYGHYREASYTQIKHHWWWKIHRARGLPGGGPYVSPDLLHALTLLQRLRPALCPACQVLALGNYNKLSPRIYKNFVERGDWWVNKYNLGFAMDASLWSRLTKCKDKFCHFDDYNWDWTMTNVVQTCLPQRLLMLSVRLTRVLHLGSCGTHVRKKGCDVKAEVRNAVSRFASSREWLFPETLALQGSWKSSGKPKRGNGGWGDYRDRQLCLAIGNHTADEATLGRLQGMRSS